MSRIKALVKPKMLVWSRTHSGLSLEAIANKIHCSADDIRAWESGSEHPRLTQAKKLAHLYRRPLIAFYLSEPPKDFAVPLTDFRRLTGATGAMSPELRLIIRLAEQRQQWTRDILEAEGQPPHDWIGSADWRKVSAPKLATRIRNWLSVPIHAQLHAPDGFQLWLKQIESKGVFVFQTGARPYAVDLGDVRGLALSDSLAPFIVVNAKDSKNGRTFTLIHELVHLWIGEPGISNADPGDRIAASQHPVEVYCNAAAAEVLIPAEWLETEWKRSSDTDDQRIERLAKSLRVSRESVARRAADFDWITRKRYEGLRSLYKSQWDQQKEKEKNREGGPSFVTLISQRAGETFTRMVLSSYMSGNVSARDVSELLQSKLEHLPQVADQVGLAHVGL